MITIIENEHKLCIARMYSAMRERVFRAWTEADEIGRWWHAGEAYAPSQAEVDARPGGHFRLGMLSSSTGKEDIVSGEYREFHPPERLVFTWTYRQNEAEPQGVTLVTLQLFDHGKNTELLLVHEGFLSDNAKEQASRMWNACLAQLASFLHEAESPSIELCVVVDATDDRVFRALTDAQQLVRWFPTAVENDPVAGGGFTYTWEYAGDPARNHMRCGSYTEVIPNKTVCHTWDARPQPQHGDNMEEDTKPTLVEFRLTPEAGGGTRVMLVHSGWESGHGWIELRDSHLREWTFFLSNLKSYLENGADERSKELGMRCAETVQGIGY